MASRIIRDDDDDDDDEVNGAEMIEESQPRSATRVPQAALPRKRPAPASSEDDDSEEEEDDDDDDDDDEEEEEEEDTRGASGGRKRRRKERASRFLEAEAESDDDEELTEAERARLKAEQERDDVPEAQRRRLAQRLEERKAFDETKPEDLAARFEARHQESLMRERRAYGAVQGSGRGGAEIARATRDQPSIKDPKLFCVRCKPGRERGLVVRLMRKSIDALSRPPPPTGGANPTWNYVGTALTSASQQQHELQILSVLSTGSKGFFYVEAYKEEHVRHALHNLTDAFASRVSIVPLDQMMDVMRVEMKKEAIKPGSWIRLRRYPYRGDLARVLSVSTAGNRLWVQYVPRLDYGAIKNGVKNLTAKDGKLPPAAKLFSVEEATAAGIVPSRAANREITGEDIVYDYIPETEQHFDKYGFLNHYVSPMQVSREKIQPTVDELRIFSTILASSSGNNNASSATGKDQTDDGQRGLLMDVLAQEIAKGSGVSGASQRVADVVSGDAIVVLSGDLKSVKARVLETNPSVGTAKVKPTDPRFMDLGEVHVKLTEIAKLFEAGDHVKVTAGRHAGTTGVVVKAEIDANPPVARIFTDITGRDISAFMADLRITEQVAASMDSLGGYKLYDLVRIGHESGVVCEVRADTLCVMKRSGQVVPVKPSDLKGRIASGGGPPGKNQASRHDSAMDSNNDIINVGDPVTIVNGPHVGSQGVVKHTDRASLFVFSRNRPQNAGVFVVRARDSKLSGTRLGGTAPRGPQGNNLRAGGFVGSRKGDTSVGQTVAIRVGIDKGLQGRIVEATDDNVRVELFARPKIISVPRENVLFIDANGGSVANQPPRPRPPPSFHGAAGAPTPYAAHTVPPQTPGYAQIGRTPAPNMIAATPAPSSHTMEIDMDDDVKPSLANSAAAGPAAFKVNDRVRVVRGEDADRLGKIIHVSASDAVLEMQNPGNEKPSFAVKKFADFVRV